MNEVVPIQNKIYEIRGQRVMLDRDLAELYGVTTGALNQAVKRNSERFPTDFMFRLTDTETENWKSQIVITNSITKGLRRNPYAFTEQGVSMLSAVLKSPTAVQTSIAIMRAFAAMRNYIASTTTVTAELSELRAKLALLERADTDNAEAINDLSEDMRRELDGIYEAIAALSVRIPKAQPPRRPIGYKKKRTASLAGQPKRDCKPRLRKLRPYVSSADRKQDGCLRKMVAFHRVRTVRSLRSARTAPETAAREPRRPPGRQTALLPGADPVALDVQFDAGSRPLVDGTLLLQDLAAGVHDAQPERERPALGNLVSGGQGVGHDIDAEHQARRLGNVEHGLARRGVIRRRRREAGPHVGHRILGRDEPRAGVRAVETAAHQCHIVPPEFREGTRNLNRVSVHTISFLRKDRAARETSRSAAVRAAVCCGQR